MQRTATGTRTLGPRQLGRATLARQHLLARLPVGSAEAQVEAVVAHLVGMQAQEPRDPYLALWSRVERFDPLTLESALWERRVVRTGVMRGTVHLVTADDALTLGPLTQPLYDGFVAGPARRRALGPDLGIEALRRETLALLADGPVSRRDLRAALVERHPDADPTVLVESAVFAVSAVQVPPRGCWTSTGGVRLAATDAWLGRPLEGSAGIDDVVRRYLAAFGPASSADVTTWCRLSGMREVLERLRPRLRTFRDEGGRELFDVPDGPIPDPDVPAPTRLLPTYDNVLLSHDDRSRFFADPDDRRRLWPDDMYARGTVLHDGTVVGTWRRPRGGAGGGRMEVTHVRRLSKRAASAITAEARRAARFLDPASPTPEVELIPSP